MPETTSIINAQRFAKGLTFKDYMDSIGETRARFEPHIAAFTLSESDTEFFKDAVHKTGAIKIVAIGEDWCPDVHRGLPVVAKISEASGMELRFFHREKNLDVMNLFLKDGKFQSIPVFAFFNGNFNYLTHWIERPVEASKFYDQIRAELSSQKLPEEEMRKAMREKAAPLADIWRSETVQEIRAHLSDAIKTS
jgi:hypothetical protein